MRARTIHTVLLLLGLSTNTLAQEHRIEYRWLNFPCSEMINCDAGCSACNVPVNSDPVFFGTNAAFIGLVTCPLPINVGDNAVYSAGWSLMPDPAKVVILSGFATVPMRIDSLIFRHAIYSTGPTRVKIAFTDAAAAPAVEWADIEVPSDFEDVVLTDMGCVQAQPGGAFGTFQIRFSAYGSNDGGWALDEVRIVATACSTGQVGMVEWSNFQRDASGPWFDLLGRPMNGQPAPGAYIDATRRIRVF